MPGSKSFNGKICSLTPGCKRRQRYLDGGCDPCHWRTVEEGTAKKPEPTPARLAMIQLVKDYNKLIRKGMKQFEIAALWGLSRRKLAVKIYRAKRFYGLKVVDGSTVRWIDGKPVTVNPINSIRSWASDHGQGTKGKQGCFEECCMSVRRATWRRYNEAYRARKRAQREAKRQSGEMS